MNPPSNLEVNTSVGSTSFTGPGKEPVTITHTWAETIVKLVRNIFPHFLDRLFLPVPSGPQNSAVQVPKRVWEEYKSRQPRQPDSSASAVNTSAMVGTVLGATPTTLASSPQEPPPPSPRATPGSVTPPPPPSPRATSGSVTSPPSASGSARNSVWLESLRLEEGISVEGGSSSPQMSPRVSGAPGSEGSVAGPLSPSSTSTAQSDEVKEEFVFPSPDLYPQDSTKKKLEIPESSQKPTTVPGTGTSTYLYGSSSINVMAGNEPQAALQQPSTSTPAPSIETKSTFNSTSKPTYVSGGTSSYTYMESEKFPQQTLPQRLREPIPGLPTLQSLRKDQIDEPAMKNLAQFCRMTDYRPERDIDYDYGKNALRQQTLIANQLFSKIKEDPRLKDQMLSILEQEISQFVKKHPGDQSPKTLLYFQEELSK